MMAWWDDLGSSISGFLGGGGGGNWLGNLGTAASIGSLGLGGYSTIMNSLRASEQARQMDRYNRQLQQFNAQQADVNRQRLAMEQAANAQNLTLQQQANVRNQQIQQQALAAAQAEQAQRQQGYGQLAQFAQTPFDPTQYYKPMADAEAAARRRAIMGELTARGIPLDSGYATNLIAEEMAGGESQRYQQAAQQAYNVRGQTGNLLGSAIPGSPQWPYQQPGLYTPGFSQPGAPRQPGQYPQISGPDVGGAATYLGLMGALRRQQQPQQQPTQYSPYGPWAQAYNFPPGGARRGEAGTQVLGGFGDQDQDLGGSSLGPYASGYR